MFLFNFNIKKVNVVTSTYCIVTRTLTIFSYRVVIFDITRLLQPCNSLLYQDSQFHCVPLGAVSVASTLLITNMKAFYEIPSSGARNTFPSQINIFSKSNSLI